MDRPYRRLGSHPDFEVPVPSRASVVGFLALIGLAGLMVVGLHLWAAWLKS